MLKILGVLAVVTIATKERYLFYYKLNYILFQVGCEDNEGFKIWARSIRSIEEDDVIEDDQKCA